MKLAAPVIVDVPFHEEDRLVEEALDDVDTQIDDRELTSDGRELLKTYPTVYIIRGKRHRKAKSDFEFDEYLLYVGETNSIVRRTKEHYSDEKTYRSESARKAWQRLNAGGSRMLVIGQDHFNKSLTLDLENTFLSYLLASDAKRVTLVNGRGNPQDDYYTKADPPAITSTVWRKLNRYEPQLFPAESVIRDSAIFKASPFHALGPEQLVAEDKIIARLRQTLATAGAGSAATAAAADPHAPVEKGELIIVEGLAGTGKTVLLSHLFLRIANELGDDAYPLRANLLINHNEQLTVYNQIMLRLGLQNKAGQVVLKPTEFINNHSEPGHGRGLDKQDFPTDPVDVALIDEAHLLLTQGNQGYRGSRNMLVDVMRRARVVIAVYDLEQVLRKSQELAPGMQKALFPAGRYADGSAECARRAARLCDFDFSVTNLLLRQQFRIDACDEVVQWIDDFANGRGIGHIPRDPAREGHDPYEIRVFRSPFELRSAIQEKAITFDDKTGELVDDERHGLSRVLATYDWPYTKKSRPASGAWEVQIYQEHNEWVAFDQNDDTLPQDVRDEVAAGDTSDFFHMPWNYETDPADKQEATGEKGKAWAEQPHTLNECGSIYTIQGFDLNFAGVIIGPSVCWRDGHVEFDPSKSKNRQAINGSDAPKENLRHELNVLLKRGVHGLYLFAVDHELEEHLLKMQGA
ncbi:MAG: DUF2075 domain-containing protein [Olsenella sp.]|jgi:DUF2075 family protein|nr:DUF2075 domain-containing protein [Olsenella sp.]MCI1288262.1 DUF2075 domain-containing protein [Olsenella sp.]